MSFAIVFGMTSSMGVSAAKKVSLSSKTITVFKGQSKTIKVKNTKKVVKWKITSGKQYITLNKKGKTVATIRGKKKGTAKIRATVGKKKFVCKVTVKENTSKSETINVPVPTANTQPVVTVDSFASTTSPSVANPTNAPDGVNEQDVVALKVLIAQQRALGADISEDIYNEEQYKWENGRLTGIYWNDRKLTDKLDVSGCSALMELRCGSNQLTALDVTKNTSLSKLDCSYNQLTALEVTKNVELITLWCDENELTALDVSENTGYKELH